MSNETKQRTPGEMVQDFLEDNNFDLKVEPSWKMQDDGTYTLAFRASVNEKPKLDVKKKTEETKEEETEPAKD